MKIKNVLFLAIMLVGCTSFAQETAGKLTLSEEFPKPGQTVKLIYEPSPKLLKADNVTAVAYLFNRKAAYTVAEISWRKSDGNWTGELALPDTSVYFGINISNEKLSDNNNDKGNAFALYGSNDRPLKAAYAVEAHLFRGLGNYILGIKASPEKALSALEKELEAYPDTRKEQLGTYYSLLPATQKEKKAKVKAEMLAAFKQKGWTEDSLLPYANAFGREKQIYDSLSAVMKTRFPKGQFVRNVKVNSFFSQKQLAKKVEVYKELKEEYGDFPNADQMLTSIATAYADSADYENFTKYAALVNDKSRLAGLYNSVAWKLAEKGESLEFAAGISKKSLDLVLDQEINPPAHFVTLTSTQKQRSIDYPYSTYADTYASILFKQGKKEEALKYQEKAVTRHGYPSTKVFERYAELLIANDRNTDARSKIEEFVKNRGGTAKIREVLKTLYIVEKSSEAGFDAYLTGLEAVAKEKRKNELLEEMLNMKAPAFTLKGFDGKEVSLASLKGKVVVVDFWATWCGPCIASFPGMQMAVNKYKDNPDVKFLFIDTWESGAKRLETVKDFIRKNNYTFHVLMDEEQDNKHIVVSSFNVEGIPTKFVLDKNGMIRFKSVGFRGSAEATVDELSLMIEMASNPSENKMTSVN